MLPQKKIIRGLQDIRTLTGKVNQEVIPYKTFMQLSCLEMEKFRRGKERESAAARVMNIDIRTAIIDLEKERLLNLLGAKGDKSETTFPGETNDKDASSSKPGFKLKY